MVIELFDRSRRNKESLWSPSHKLFAPTYKCFAVVVSDEKI